MQEKNGDILAISVDPPARLSESHREYPELPCQLASASDGTALRALGLLHPLTRGKFVAAPASILVNRGGEIVWTHYAEIVMDRPDPREVLEKVHTLA